MSFNINKIRYIWIFLLTLIVNKTFADVTGPESYWLPEFANKKNILWGLVQSKSNNPHWFLTKWIAEWIKYAGLLAVISLTIGWIMYMLSMWVDAKTKKAKDIIMYSIIWVLISILAYSLVDIINSINLN